MGNFNRNNSYGGRGNQRSYSDNNSSRPEMHHATCADCGNDCQVPFRPTGDKPVYCSDCFGRNRGESRPQRPDRNSGRGNDRRFGSDEKRMYEAVCGECGNKCEVPFRPSQDKPVYCSDCFGNKGNKSRGSEQPNKQSDDLNKKLDKIISLLNILVPENKRPEQENKKAKKQENKTEEKAIKEEESKPKAKTAEKKPATKKAPAKAKATKKPTAKKVVKKKK